MSQKQTYQGESYLHLTVSVGRAVRYYASPSPTSRPAVRGSRFHPFRAHIPHRLTQLCTLCLLLLGFQLFAQTDTLDYPPTRQGFQSLINDLRSPNRKLRKSLLQSLQPTQADFLAVFQDEDYARSMYQYHKQTYRSSRFGYLIQPNLPEQTETILWQADAQSLKNYTGEAIYFPGGYREIADHLSPDYQYFRFKYVEPGRSTGSAYEMFVFVNDRWVYIPRPWAFEIK